MERITKTNKFAIKDENGMWQYFSGMAADKQKKILQTNLLIYECEGTESEIKEWFRTINIMDCGNGRFHASGGASDSNCSISRHVMAQPTVLSTL